MLTEFGSELGQVGLRPPLIARFDVPPASSDWPPDLEELASGSVTLEASCSWSVSLRHSEARRCLRSKADSPVGEPKLEATESIVRSWTRTRSSNWSTFDFEALPIDRSGWHESLQGLPRLDTNFRTWNAF